MYFEIHLFWNTSVFKYDLWVWTESLKQKTKETINSMVQNSSAIFEENLCHHFPANQPVLVNISDCIISLQAWKCFRGSTWFSQESSAQQKQPGETHVELHGCWGWSVLAQHSCRIYTKWVLVCIKGVCCATWSPSLNFQIDAKEVI